MVCPGACATSSSGGRAIAGRQPDGAAVGEVIVAWGGFGVACSSTLEIFSGDQTAREIPNTAEGHGTLGLIVTKAEGGLRRVVALPKKNKFAADSLLEGTGFEPSVPLFGCRVPSSARAGGLACLATFCIGEARHFVTARQSIAIQRGSTRLPPDGKLRALLKIGK
jgi:hypothetical protein